MYITTKMYITKCPANNCNDDYVGETGPPISEVIVGHNGRDINSHLSKHYIEKEHQCLQNKDFVIISSGFWNNTIKKKISEVL